MPFKYINEVISPWWGREDVMAVGRLGVLEALVRDQIKAIDLLDRNRLSSSSLMLIYTTIDILGSVSIEKQKSTNRECFFHFVNEYMGENLPEGVYDIDLWGARCGLLHAYSPESDHSRAQKAKQLIYACGAASKEELQYRIAQQPNSDEYVAVHVDDLINALRDGCVKLIKGTKDDPLLRKRAEERVLTFYNFDRVYGPDWIRRGRKGRKEVG
jgi:hypothetical protein